MKEVNVEHDDQVKKDDIVLVQESNDLEKDIASATGEWSSNVAKLQSASSELFDNKDLTETERGQKQGEVKELTEKR